jgi:hypothetical protein
MPPKGRPYGYSPEKIRTKVPEEPGVYWLWSFGRLVRVGQSVNLRRRLLEYSDQQPNRFRFQTVRQYFARRSWALHPLTPSVKRCLDKIEHAELTWFQRKHGRLPDWNAQQKQYEPSIVERLLSTALS